MMKTFVIAMAMIATNAALAADGTMSSREIAGPAGDSRWDVALGAQVRHRPDYLGSEETTAHLLPMFRISYASGLGTARLDVPVGAEAPLLSLLPFETANASLGVGIGVDPGRSETDPEPFRPGSRRLAGMGKVSSTSVAALIGSYRLHGITIHGLYRAAIDSDKGHGGQLGTLHVAYSLPFGGPVSIRIGAGMTWADRKYMQNMFGVTPQQSANTGFAAYSPDKGVRDYSVGLDLRYKIQRNVALYGGAHMVRLAGDAADSPIVEEDTQPRIYAGAMYHW